MDTCHSEASSSFDTSTALMSWHLKAFWAVTSRGSDGMHTRPVWGRSKFAYELEFASHCVGTIPPVVRSLAQRGALAQCYSLFGLSATESLLWVAGRGRFGRERITSRMRELHSGRFDLAISMRSNALHRPTSLFAAARCCPSHSPHHPSRPMKRSLTTFFVASHLASSWTHRHLLTRFRTADVGPGSLSRNIRNSLLGPRISRS